MALPTTGRDRLAKMPMIEITTKSSIRVKAELRMLRVFCVFMLVVLYEFYFFLRKIFIFFAAPSRYWVAGA